MQAFEFVVFGHYTNDYHVKVSGNRNDCDAAERKWFADHPNAHFRDAFVRPAR